MLCCGINEEGSRIVSSGEDCTVRVWSTEDGAQLMMLAAQVRGLCVYGVRRGGVGTPLFVCGDSALSSLQCCALLWPQLRLRALRCD